MSRHPYRKRVVVTAVCLRQSGMHAKKLASQFTIRRLRARQRACADAWAVDALGLLGAVGAEGVGGAL